MTKNNVIRLHPTEPLCSDFIESMVVALRNRYRMKQDTLKRQGVKVNQIQHLIEVLGSFNAEILHDAYHQSCPSLSQENRDMLLEATIDSFTKYTNKLEWRVK